MFDRGLNIPLQLPNKQKKIFKVNDRNSGAISVDVTQVSLFFGDVH